MNQDKIKFPLKEKPEFISELREKVGSYFKTNNISKFGNTNLILKSVFMFSLYVIPYVLMITGIISSLGGVFACWAIIGLGKAGVGMGVMHDANHRTWSKNPTVNKWMSKTLYMLGGFPPTWQHQHNTLHHGYTNIEGVDEDINPGPYIRISPHKPLLKVHKFQFIYAWFLYGLMTLMWVTTKDFLQLNRYRKDKVPLSGSQTYFQLFIILILSKILYYGVFFVLPLMVLPFQWYFIVLFFLTMHFVTGFILTTIFQTAHVVTTSEYPLPDTEGNMENNWAIHQLLTTSDFAPKSRVLSWLIGGLNYQVEHHLFPNISHVHYPKISAIVRETALKYSLPYYVQPGFISAIGEHTRMLKKLGRK
jgi:linoleoyl-CoA desaturase